MFNDLSALGYGLVVFAIIIGVGTIVLYEFGGSVGCNGGVVQGSWNGTAGACQNATGQNTPTGTGYTNLNFLTTQLGQSGLAGWTPAIIAISVGLLFLGAFVIGRGNKKRY